MSISSGVKKLIRHKDSLFHSYDLIVLDSADALNSRQEYVGSDNKSRGLDNDNPGVKARKWSEGLRKIVGALANCKCSLYAVCQLRSKIGQTRGKLEDVTGGNAMKYYSSFRLYVWRGDWIEEGTGENKERIGFYRKVALEKTKISANEGKIAEMPYIFGSGVDSLIGIFNTAIGPIIENRGAWFYSDLFHENGKGKRAIQGRSAAIQFFRENKPEAEKLEQAVDHYRKNSHEYQVPESEAETHEIEEYLQHL